MSNADSGTSSQQPFELENQFIIRLPEVPGTALKDALKSGNTNLKERLKLKLDADARQGTLFLDHFVLPSKLVDLPCVIESFKTIDRKTLYKTADVCQMLICMEEEEPQPPPNEEKPQKKKDNKVDKKYLYPHGITPPLKNVRKRRFRKTLKKKQYLDQPEIEREVRRLLRADYEAHHISWEVIDEEEDKTKEGGGRDVLMQGSKTNEDPTKSGRMVEELFGDVLSDSDAEDEEMGMGGGELDDESRISMDMEMEGDESSRMSDSAASFSQSHDAAKTKEKKGSYVTSFSKDMFATPGTSSSSGRRSRSPDKSQRLSQKPGSGSASDISSLSRAELQSQLNLLKNQLTEISARRQIQEMELSTTDNVALRNRLETVLNKLVNDQSDKEREIRDVEKLLDQDQM